MEPITQLLDRARGGDVAAWDRVVALLYEDLLRLAHRVHANGRGQTLDATALVHECYLRLARQGAEAIHDRGHFLAVAARAMRQILVNHARDRGAAKRGGGAAHTSLEHLEIAAAAEAGEVIALDAALTALEREDARLVRVVDCRVFAGLTEAETAQALALPLRSVQRLWQEARARLQAQLADA